MSDSTPTPVERQAEEAREAEFKREVERKLDDAIKNFVDSMGKDEASLGFRRWEVVQAAIKYAQHHNLSYFDEVKPAFMNEFKFRAEEERRNSGSA